MCKENNLNWRKNSFYLDKLRLGYESKIIYMSIHWNEMANDTPRLTSLFAWDGKR